MRINKTYIDINPWKEKYPDVKGKGALKELIRKEIGKQKATRRKNRRSKCNK